MIILYLIVYPLNNFVRKVILRGVERGKIFLGGSLIDAHHLL